MLKYQTLIYENDKMSESSLPFRVRQQNVLNVLLSSRRRAL